MSGVIVFLFRLYQALFSGLLGGSCRFYPSCSTYAIEAVQRHGPWRGCWMAACRVAKCHPFHPGGVDWVSGADADIGDGVVPVERGRRLS